MIYPKDIEITKTTDTASAASFLDIYHKLDTNGQLFTRLYDKRDCFNFTIINFPHLYKNIPTGPAYGEEEIKDTKGVIRIHISKNRQHNDQMIRDKRTNNDQQNIHIKLKIE